MRDLEKRLLVGGIPTLARVIALLCKDVCWPSFTRSRAFNQALNAILADAEPQRDSEQAVSVARPELEPGLWGVWCEQPGALGFWREVYGRGPLRTTRTNAETRAKNLNRSQESRTDSLGWVYAARPYSESGAIIIGKGDAKLMPDVCPDCKATGRAQIGEAASVAAKEEPFADSIGKRRKGFLDRIETRFTGGIDKPDGFFRRAISEAFDTGATLVHEFYRAEDAIETTAEARAACEVWVIESSTLGEALLGAISAFISGYCIGVNKQRIRTLETGAALGAAAADILRMTEENAKLREQLTQARAEFNNECSSHQATTLQLDEFRERLEAAERERHEYAERGFQEALRQLRKMLVPNHPANYAAFGSIETLETVQRRKGFEWPKFVGYEEKIQELEERAEKAEREVAEMRTTRGAL